MSDPCATISLGLEEGDEQVSSEDDGARRVRFFGVHDLAAGWYVPRVAQLVEQFDPTNASSDAMDVIELHNVQQYLEHGFFPSEYSEAERATARSRIGQIRSLVARFFSAIDEANCASLISGVDHEYHADLLELLGRHKAYERCSATTMLRVLEQAGVHMSELLSCRRLVAAYDAEVRDQMVASPSNAVHLVRKHLQRDVREAVHLPRSLSQADVRDLLERRPIGTTQPVGGSGHRSHLWGLGCPRGTPRRPSESSATRERRRRLAPPCFRVRRSFDLPEDPARLLLGVGAAQCTPPLLVLSDGRPEEDQYWSVPELGA